MKTLLRIKSVLVVSCSVHVLLIYTRLFDASRYLKKTA